MEREADGLGRGRKGRKEHDQIHAAPSVLMVRCPELSVEVEMGPEQK